MPEPYSPEQDLGHEKESSSSPLNAVDKALLAVRNSLPAEKQYEDPHSAEKWDRDTIPHASDTLRSNLITQQQEVLGKEQQLRREAGLDDSFDAVFQDVYVDHKPPTGGYPPMPEYVQPLGQWDLFPILSGKGTEALLRETGVLQPDETLDDLKKSSDWVTTGIPNYYEPTLGGYMADKGRHNAEGWMNTKILGVKLGLSEHKKGEKWADLGGPTYNVRIGFDDDGLKRVLKSEIEPLSPVLRAPEAPKAA